MSDGLIRNRTKRGLMCKIVRNGCSNEKLRSRDAAIKRLYIEGHSICALGRAVGVSKQRIWQIVWRCEHRYNKKRFYATTANWLWPDLPWRPMW